MRPPKNVEIPFDLLFPLLVFYFAQLQDKNLGGEYSPELNWAKVMHTIDIQRRISIPYEQLDSMIYSFKCGVLDKRSPLGWLSDYKEENYRPLMSAFKILYPDLFREEEDGEIILIGNINPNEASEEATT